MERFAIRGHICYSEDQKKIRTVDQGYVVCEGGKSRGSALYTDETGSIHIPNLDSRFTYSLEDESIESQIQEVRYESGALIFSRRSPRPIPDEDDFFENVWARYREDKCVY